MCIRDRLRDFASRAGQDRTGQNNSATAGRVWTGRPCSVAVMLYAEMICAILYMCVHLYILWAGPDRFAWHVFFAVGSNAGHIFFAAGTCSVQSFLLAKSWSWKMFSLQLALMQMQIAWGQCCRCPKLSMLQDSDADARGQFRCRSELSMLQNCQCPKFWLKESRATLRSPMLQRYAGRVWAGKLWSCYCIKTSSHREDRCWKNSRSSVLEVLAVRYWHLICGEQMVCRHLYSSCFLMVWLTCWVDFHWWVDFH